MEFLDEDARPRFVLQSKPVPQSTSDPLTQTRILTRPITLFCISLSLCFFALSFLYLNIEPFQSILTWVGLSLLIGPFAPLSITAGDIRVGLGLPLEDPVPNDLTDSESESKKPNRRSSKLNRKISESEPVFATISAPDPVKRSNLGKRANGVVEKIEESKWSEGDVELLRKLMGKNPVGKPGRWDVIADGFNGRHRVESVIKKSKELGEKKMGDEDSYQKFLKDRKRIDSSVNEGGDVKKIENLDVKKVVVNEIVWSSGEDLALLNALKTFPKEVAMRWEKIAVAVPGKTKAACMKRVTELKKDFRSSKAANGES